MQPKIVDNICLQWSFHLAGSIEGASLKEMIRLLVSFPTVLMIYLPVLSPTVLNKTMQQ